MASIAPSRTEIVGTPNENRLGQDKTGLRNRFDVLAMGVSGICMVHCVASALAILASSLTNVGHFGHEFHLALIFIAAPLTLLVLGRAARLHGEWKLLGIGTSGVVLLGAALGVTHGSLVEVALTMAGSALIIVAHALNVRRRAHRLAGQAA